MLGDIERKLAALVADAVAARTHLVVERRAARPADRGAGHRGGGIVGADGRFGLRTL